jgi:hypothetical protein
MCVCGRLSLCSFSFLFLSCTKLNGSRCGLLKLESWKLRVGSACEITCCEAVTETAVVCCRSYRGRTTARTSGDRGMEWLGVF